MEFAHPKDLDPERVDGQMKAWQSEPRLGKIPRGPLSTTEYMQPQRYAYRLARGFALMRED